MSGSLNKVQLIGNLGADPEIRSLGDSGDKVANLRIATSEQWKDRDSGERKERTEWHTVSVFGGLVNVIERFIKKGSKVYVEGQLQTRKWQDQQGNDRYSTEIVVRGFGGTLTMLDGNSSGNNAGGSPDQGAGSQSSNTGGADQGGSQMEDIDDDIPF